MFEENFEILMKKRKDLNNTNSFQEISLIWASIKENYKKCKEELSQVQKNLNDLSASAVQILETDLSFEAAFEEMKNISDELKNCSISDLPNHIKRLKDLRNFCLTTLEKEKASFTEIK